MTLASSYEVPVNRSSPYTQNGSARGDVSGVGTMERGFGDSFTTEYEFAQPEEEWGGEGGVARQKTAAVSSEVNAQ